MVIDNQTPVEVITDPEESAKAVGLRYMMDDGPGIKRESKANDFVYINPDGTPVEDEKTLDRIRLLRIPPAWTQIWISPKPNSHLQATGRDTRGRKQYIYHPKWREVRDENKFGKMLLFGQALPKIRERVTKDLDRPGLPREKVLATIVRLLETTLIRVGNEEYARTNRSYGLTTLRDKHVTVEGSSMCFEFRGKKGKNYSIGLRDRRLAGIVKRLQDLPGQDLFQYVDESGELVSIGSADVNDYLREITGEDFTAKDFRTWAGTVLAALALEEFEEFESESKAKKNIVEAVKNVAERLGNTPAISRKSYIHPAIIDCYLDGTLVATLSDAVQDEIESGRDLQVSEAAILRLLQKRLEQEIEELSTKAA